MSCGSSSSSSRTCSSTGSPHNQKRTDDAFAALCQTVTFLRQHGIVHFDAHFGNVLTDGDEFYLADFGLVLDGTFELYRH